MENILNDPHGYLAAKTEREAVLAQTEKDFEISQGRVAEAHTTRNEATAALDNLTKSRDIAKTEYDRSVAAYNEKGEKKAADELRKIEAEIAKAKEVIHKCDIRIEPEKRFQQTHDSIAHAKKAIAALTLASEGFDRTDALDRARVDLFNELLPVAIVAQIPLQDAPVFMGLTFSQKTGQAVHMPLIRPQAHNLQFNRVYLTTKPSAQSAG